MTRRWKDCAAVVAMGGAALFCVLLAFAIAVALLLKCRPILATTPVGKLLLSSSWRPSRGEFGFYPFIMGTLWVSGLAILLTAPVCLLCAIYLGEYAHSRVRSAAKPLLDVLAGIPSVVFGLWGMLAIVPMVAKLSERLGWWSTGYCVLSAAVVLAIMVFPVIISITVEVLAKVPLEAREAALALGATRWQTTKQVVLRAAFPGVFAAVVLGFSRAFGETMAVLMVAGNGYAQPHSLLDPAQTLPALIANNFGEMMSVPRYDAALMFAALVLLAVVLVFNVLATVVLRRLEGRMA